MSAGVVRIESDAETCGDLAMLLPEPFGLDAAAVEVIELPEAGEGNVRRPGRGEGVKRPGDLKAVIVAVGVHAVAEVGLPVAGEECRIGVADADAGTVDAVLPSDLHVFAQPEEVGFRQRRADRAFAAFAAGLGFRRDRPGVLRGDGDVDDAVVRLGCDDRRGLEKAERTQIALGLGEPRGAVRIAFVEEEKLLDDGRARLDVQPVSELVERSVPCLRVRINIERMDGDGADTEGRLRLRAERGGDCEPEEREEDGFHRMQFLRVADRVYWRRGTVHAEGAERREKICYPARHTNPGGNPWTVIEADGSKSSLEACSPENRRS